MQLTKLAQIVIFFGTATSVQAVNLVQNGSFETTTLTGSDYLANNAAFWSTNSYTFLVFPGTAQTNIGNGVKLYPGITHIMPATSPDKGNFVAADGAYQTGFISQTINGLAPGQLYQLSFYQAEAQQQGYNGDTTDRFQVTLGAQTQLSEVFTNLSNDFTPWVKETLTFSATSSSEVLSFLAVGTPTGVPPFALLDGVSLVQAPEPGTVWLFSGALLACSAGLRMLRAKRPKSV